jgi:hypothetical protein
MEESACVILATEGRNASKKRCYHGMLQQFSTISREKYL